MQLASGPTTQLSESPSGRRQPAHRNTSGGSPSRAAAAAAGPLREHHGLGPCSGSGWPDESSDSRRLRSEGSVHVPWSPHAQRVEAQPRQLCGAGTPAISANPAAAGHHGTPGRLGACAGRGRAADVQAGPRRQGRGLAEAGRRAGFLVRMLAAAG